MTDADRCYLVDTGYAAGGNPDGRARMAEERRWWVFTPEYGEVVPILDYGQGPMEYQCDAVAVWARTKREAKVRAVPLLRKLGGWMRDVDGNPFVGLSVELHQCQHSTDADGEICDACEARFADVDAIASSGVEDEALGMSGTIVALWSLYEQEVMLGGASAVQVQERRRAFYAGAAQMFGLIRRGLVDPAVEAGETDLSFMADLWDELRVIAFLEDPVRENGVWRDQSPPAFTAETPPRFAPGMALHLQRKGLRPLLHARTHAERAFAGMVAAQERGDG